MAYKVFFVEDEIVTREGIRDNVDWQANGFAFCGEATDGEMALPLMQMLKPDVLITDIKMPFMDGLQLSKIVRERMPQVKIIILSGHDEFEYAQKAIELGVTEYLLKPITVQSLHKALRKIALQLDQEKKDQEALKRLQAQVDEDRAALRERLLMKLVVGAISSTEAIEQAQDLGLDLVARCYLVVILKAELADRTEQFDYEEYQRVQKVIAGLVEENPDIIFLKKDWEEIVLLMKGSTVEYLEEERDELLQAIARQVQPTRYQIRHGAGAPKKRIAEISQSFIEALVNMRRSADENAASANQPIEKRELLKVDTAAVENFLRFGVKESFDAFFDASIGPMGEAILRSDQLKSYIFVDFLISSAKLVDAWGGDIDQVIPEVGSIETALANIKSLAQLREQSARILTGALAYRDANLNRQHNRLIHQAKTYIARCFTQPELSLNDVAAHVNLSPSHFSVVFSQETGQTFKDYLTELRISKAKELLLTSSLRSAEISEQVGYSDPHYFSTVFKKNSGYSPSEFRALTQKA